MMNEKTVTRSHEKPITEGYLAGGGALLVAILWILFDAFHPMIILALYLVAIICLSIATLWLLSKEKTIKEWYSGQPVRYYASGFIGLFYVLTSLALIVYG